MRRSGAVLTLFDDRRSVTNGFTGKRLVWCVCVLEEKVIQIPHTTSAGVQTSSRLVRLPRHWRHLSHGPLQLSLCRMTWLVSPSFDIHWSQGPFIRQSSDRRLILTVPIFLSDSSRGVFRGSCRLSRGKKSRFAKITRIHIPLYFYKECVKFNNSKALDIYYHESSCIMLTE